MALGGHSSSELIDTPAHCCVVEALAVHLLRLDLFARGIDELVVLPKRRLRASKFDALLDEELSVDILSIAHVLADELRIGAMGKDLPIQLIDDDVKVAIVKSPGLTGDRLVG